MKTNISDTCESFSINLCDKVMLPFMFAGDFVLKTCLDVLSLGLCSLRKRASVSVRMSCMRGESSVGYRGVSELLSCEV
jgi:hypothetical protein